MDKILVSPHPLSNIKITKYFNYKRRCNDAFLRDNLSRETKKVSKVKELIGIHYLLTKIQLHNLILLGLNILHKMY